MKFCNILDRNFILPKVKLKFLAPQASVNRYTIKYWLKLFFYFQFAYRRFCQSVVSVRFKCLYVSCRCRRRVFRLRRLLKFIPIIYYLYT